MKKVFVFVIAFLLLGASVFAATELEVTEEAAKFVEDFVAKRGVASEDIKNVSQVDFNDLPKEVNIEHVGDTNLAIYQVDYEENNKNKKVFVVTYSVEQLKAQGDLIVASNKRNFLDFGFSGVMVDSGFLETAAGVETSGAKGYVMPRDGSITAISTSLEIIQANAGEIEIVIIKNGKPASFGNTLSASAIGVQKDYDVQSKEIVAFNAGDVISVAARGSGDISWRDVITIVEITTVD